MSNATLALIFECMMLLVLVPFVIFALYQVLFMRTAPYVRTKPADVERMLKLAGPLEGKRTLELGSGNGEISICAAAAGAMAEGIEANPALVWWSRVRAMAQRVGKRTKFRSANFFHNHLDRSVDIVFLYLLPHAMDELFPKLQRDLKPGTILISNAFEFKGLVPEYEEEGVRRYVLP